MKMSVFGTVPNDVWFEICYHSSVKSLCMLRATCKGLRDVLDCRIVWRTALNDLIQVKDSLYSPEDVEKMSVSELRDATIRIARVDCAFRSSKLPHRKTSTPLEINPSKYTDVALMPGGENLLFVGRYGSLVIRNIATGTKILSHPYYEGSNRSTSTWTKVVGIYPTSLHTGYIPIVVRDYNSEFYYDMVIAQELRVYKYSRNHISHILTEQFRSRPVLRLRLSLQQDALCITWIYLPETPDERVIPVATRIIDATGRDEKEDTHFRIDVPLSEHPRNESLDLLSHKYACSCPRYDAGVLQLFDISQANKAPEPAIALQPVWSGEVDAPLWLLKKVLQVDDHMDRLNPNSPTSRALLLSKEQLYVLKIPASPETNADVSLSSSPIPESPLRMDANLHIHGTITLGLISMQHKREPPRRHVARTGVWSYTVDYAQDQGHARAPGYMRLERPQHGPLPKGKLGNTLRVFTAEGIEAESMDFRVDSFSGRFVQFPKLPAWSDDLDVEELIKIDMYTFDGFVASVGE